MATFHCTRTPEAIQKLPWWLRGKAKRPSAQDTATPLDVASEHSTTTPYHVRRTTRLEIFERPVLCRKENLESETNSTNMAPQGCTSGKGHKTKKSKHAKFAKIETFSR